MTNERTKDKSDDFHFESEMIFISDKLKQRERKHIMYVKAVFEKLENLQNTKKLKLPEVQENQMSETANVIANVC